MRALIVRGDALRLPLPDESVDLIVTSPPYWSQRSYRDGGEHYVGQIGSEPHPRGWLEAMWAVMAECWRVLKPQGSAFINLGDKRAGSGGHNNSGISAKSTLRGNGHVGGVGAAGPNKIKATLRNAPDRYEQAHFGRRKSRQGLPERFVIGCEDGLADPERIGWVWRQTIVWHKANCIPESVADRTRDDFEFVYHLTKSEDYFSAVDEIRTALAPKTLTHRGGGKAWGNGENPDNNWTPGDRARVPDPRGALPGSVWTIPSEPLRIPDEVRARLDLPDHFAAFPQEWPRRIVLGWSPSGICTACGEGRKPVVDVEYERRQRDKAGSRTDRNSDNNRNDGEAPYGSSALRHTTILGYACACTPYTDQQQERRGFAYHDHSADESAGNKGTQGRTYPLIRERVREYHLSGWTPPPTTPAVVLDPFGGTGTTALVAHTLGRIGISVDLSSDYCRLARWRIEHSGHGAKAEQRTYAEMQGTLF